MKGRIIPKQLFEGHTFLAVEMAQQHSAPPQWSGRCGRQAAWGLLRDQINVCVPTSSSISRA